MIRVLLILLLALLVGTGLSLGLTYDLGYIRISLGNYLIETNFWVGLGLILVIILLTVTLINTVRRFRQGTGVMAGWIARGNERRARRRTPSRRPLALPSHAHTALALPYRKEKNQIFARAYCAGVV